MINLTPQAKFCLQDGTTPEHVNLNDYLTPKEKEKVLQDGCLIDLAPYCMFLTESEEFRPQQASNHELTAEQRRLEERQECNLPQNEAELIAKRARIRNGKMEILYVNLEKPDYYFWYTIDDKYLETTSIDYIYGKDLAPTGRILLSYKTDRPMQITTTKKYNKNRKKGDEEIEYQFVTIRVTGSLKDVTKSVETIPNQQESSDLASDHRVCDENHMASNNIGNTQVKTNVSFAETNINLERESNEGFD